MDVLLSCLHLFLIWKTVTAGRNSFRSDDFVVMDMIKTEGRKIEDDFGKTQLVASFAECVSLCFFLNGCLSVNAAPTKQGEWLCYPTRLAYEEGKELMVPAGTSFSNYAFNNHVLVKSSPVRISPCVALQNANRALKSGMYSVTIPGELPFDVYCDVVIKSPACNFEFGEGISERTVKQPGTFPSKESCVQKCAAQHLSDPAINGATIDTAKERECWCEKKMSGRNSNSLYKSCQFESAVISETWLEVARLDTSKHGQFRVEDAESDEISKLGNVKNGKFALSRASLINLRAATNFTQVRFRCSKNATGRTIDIATVPTNTAVIDWLLSDGRSVPPQSCGTFYKLPNDNSVLSNSCNQWNDQRGRWGAWPVSRKLLWTMTFYINSKNHWWFPNDHDGINWMANSLCDDVWLNDPTFGNWSIYVK